MLILAGGLPAAPAAGEEQKAPPLALIGDIRRRVIDVRAALETERAARAGLQALVNRQSAELLALKEAMADRERELQGKREVAEQRVRELLDETAALKKDLSAASADLDKERTERRLEEARAAEARANQEAEYKKALQTAQNSMRELQAHLRRIKESAETKEQEYAARLQETEAAAAEQVQTARQAEQRARGRARSLEQELEAIKQSLNGIKADFESGALQDNRWARASEGGRMP
jgi:chromosome segregation ATPase